MVSPLKCHSAAEISVGLICVCIPELGALVHRRGTTRSRGSTVNSASKSRRTNRYGIGTLGSSDEQGLWDGVPLRGQKSFADVGGVQFPPTAVTTDIEGGIGTFDHCRMGRVSRDAPYGDSAFSPKGAECPDGIFTSVRMEQSVI